MVKKLSKKGTMISFNKKLKFTKLYGQTEAWTVADYLLKQKDANLETQLFAAQTLKLKVRKHALKKESTKTLRI